MVKLPFGFGNKDPLKAMGLQELPDGLRTVLEQHPNYDNSYSGKLLCRHDSPSYTDTEHEVYVVSIDNPEVLLFQGHERKDGTYFNMVKLPLSTPLPPRKK